MTTISKVHPQSEALTGLAVRLQDDITGCEFVLFANDLKTLNQAAYLLDQSQPDQAKIWRCAFMRARDVVFDQPVTWPDADPQDLNGDLF